MIETLESRQLRQIKKFIEDKLEAVSKEFGSLHQGYTKRYISKLSEIVLLEDILKQVNHIIYGNTNNKRRW